jgi:hypothetical protein
VARRPPVWSALGNSPARDAPLACNTKQSRRAFERIGSG